MHTKACPVRSLHRSFVLNITVPGVGLGEKGRPLDWAFATAPGQHAARALVQHPRVRAQRRAERPVVRLQRHAL
eukprot:3364629-Pyramimonas_sp.AAC.1